jgi:hypothetical protein
MVKLNKELTLGVLLIVIVVMVLKPNLLGFLYNNILGKIIFVAAIVFLSLKHTAAGLLAVVFVAIIASMSGYYGFEGLAMPDDKKEKKEGMEDEDEEPAKKETTEGFKKKKCEGDDCETEGAETQKPSTDIMKEIKDQMKS